MVAKNRLNNYIIIIIMISPITVLIAAVSISILIMLGINLYLVIKSRRKEGPDANYMVLHQRMDSLSQAINDQLEKSRQASERATLTVHQQVQNFTQGMTQLHEGLKGMHDSVKSVVSFQDLFRNPKL